MFSLSGFPTRAGMTVTLAIRRLLQYIILTVAAIQWTSLLRVPDFRLPTSESSFVVTDVHQHSFLVSTKQTGD